MTQAFKTTEAQMRAVVLSEYGPVTNLRLQHVAKPKPRAGEVLVKVRATAVNDWDWSFARGEPRVLRLMYGLRRPNVNILGAEVAGTVEALGEGAKRFQVGDAVYGDVSEAGFGGFAEYACVREDALCVKPATMTFEQAAALPHASLLALQGLVDIGRIAEGESVLINGAGGGVGMFGLQIAKRCGAHVTAVDAASKLQALRDFGFDEVIDYRATDFTDNGARYDLILDAKTTRSAFRFLRALKPGGRYITVGGDLPRLLQIATMSSAIRLATGKRVEVLALKPNKGIDVLNTMFTEGKLRFLIDGPYPLEQVPQALERFGAAQHIGKLVITVA